MVVLDIFMCFISIAFVGFFGHLIGKELNNRSNENIIEKNTKNVR